MKEIEKIVEETCQTSIHPSFLYDIGQTVRIRKSLMTDTHAIQDLLGQKGVVSQRFATPIHGNCKYEVLFSNGRREVFDEIELDARYQKRTKKMKFSLPQN